MQHELFKLDAASLRDLDTPGQRIVVYHFNLPSATHTPHRASFETVLGQVERDFLPASRQNVVVPLYFQISAVYNLIHNTTGEERLWQGSFNPRSRDLGQVSPFRPFDPASFVDFAHTRSQTDRVFQQLSRTADEKESTWTLGDILSVIISFQATLRLEHSIFTSHPELAGRPGPRNADGPRGRPRTRRTVFRLDLD